MTDNEKRVAKIEARLEEATQGIWQSHGCKVSQGGASIARTYNGDTGEPFGDSSAADATFIAHAPADIRFLLSALKEAQGEVNQYHFERDRAIRDRDKAEQALAEAKETVAAFHADNVSLLDDLTEATRENERLREALESRDRIRNEMAKRLLTEIREEGKKPWTQILGERGQYGFMEWLRTERGIHVFMIPALDERTGDVTYWSEIEIIRKAQGESSWLVWEKLTTYSSQTRDSFDEAFGDMISQIVREGWLEALTTPKGDPNAN